MCAVLKVLRLGLRPGNQESRMSVAQAVSEGLHISGTGGNSTQAGNEFRHARHCILAHDTVCPR